jgi:hypothetical protein
MRASEVSVQAPCPVQTLRGSKGEFATWFADLESHDVRRRRGAADQDRSDEVRRSRDAYVEQCAKEKESESDPALLEWCRDYLDGGPTVPRLPLRFEGLLKTPGRGHGVSRVAARGEHHGSDGAPDQGLASVAPRDRQGRRQRRSQALSPRRQARRAPAQAGATAHGACGWSHGWQRWCPATSLSNRATRFGPSPSRRHFSPDVYAASLQFPWLFVRCLCQASGRRAGRRHADASEKRAGLACDARRGTSGSGGDRGVSAGIHSNGRDSDLGFETLQIHASGCPDRQPNW